jgi:predicted RNA binding protein YcfA (HicA-like mRNA interferase family)
MLNEESHLVFPSLVIKKESMKVRDIIKMIEADGWYLVVTRGSHRQYKHPVKLGRVTIAGNKNDDVAPGTLNSILKQAKLKE